MKLDLVNEFTMRAASLEVEEFLGLTRLLNVPLTTNARDHRSFEDVFIDTVAAYGKLGRSQSATLSKYCAELKKIIKRCARPLKKRWHQNASNSSNSSSQTFFSF